MSRLYDVPAWKTLHEALVKGLSVDELKPLAALVGGRGLTRKGDLVEAIVTALEGEGLRAAYEQLDDVQRRAVAEVVHSATGAFDDACFAAKYSVGPAWVEGDGRRARPTALGLFIVRRVMPADLRARLKAFVDPPAEARIEGRDEIPTSLVKSPSIEEDEDDFSEVVEVRRTESAAVAELAAVLRLVDAGRVSVSDKTWRPMAASMKAIDAVLEGGDFYSGIDRSESSEGSIRAFAWPLLLQGANLAQLSGKRLALTTAGRAALGQPPAEVLRRLWKRWVSSTLIDELSRIPTVKGQGGRAARLTPAHARRLPIAQALKACPPGRWVAIDDLRRHLLASGHVLIVSHNPWALYIGDPEYGSLAYADEGLLEIRYLMAVLFEYAATLGMVDVAYVRAAGARDDYHDMWDTDDLDSLSRYDGLLHVRLTELGRYCLELTSSWSPPIPAQRAAVRVLGDLSVTAVGGLTAADRLALDAWCEVTEGNAWRLSAETLLAAADQGRDMAEARDLLRSLSVGTLPRAVETLLDDVSARCRQVFDGGQARIIECEDAALADLIAHDVRTCKLVMRAGRRHLVVAETSVESFRRALREVGYLLAPSVKRSRT